MALVAVVQFASKLCLPGSLSSSTHKIKPVRRTIPIFRMYRRGKSVTPSVSMSLTAAVSDDDAVQRRVSDFHPNLWDDDFIQSLSTPHGAPSYRERADRLIGEVKDMFNSMSVEDGEIITALNDLLQRLLMVDNVERLGIDRYFKNEIKTALDYVYSYWNENGIGCGRDSVVTDLNSTALGLRTFRLHGYTVCSDVLEHFKDQKGQFACSAIQTEGEIRSVFNLFRASLVSFPGEKVMEEAEIFSAMYLKEALQNIPVSSLSRQIEYALEYGWDTNLPRLETRIYIDVLGQDSIYETPFMKTEKLVELAKLEFNIFRSLQQRELQCLSRWWKDYGFLQLTFTRHRHVEYYTMVSCIAIDPQHSAFRLGFSKMCHLITWEAHLDSYLKEAKWISSGYLPSFEEYLDNAKISSGFRTSILQPILALGDPLPHHILQEIDFPSKFNDLASAILRLKGDTRCYKADRARGEEASCISCYMKDNPESTEEDALNHINAMINDLIKEQNWELLRPDNNVSISSMKHAFNVSRAFHYGYKYRDGYSIASIEVKNLVKRTVLEPIPL